MFTVDFPAYGVRVEWNGSATFNVYLPRGYTWEGLGPDQGVDDWVNVDVFTVYDVADEYDAMRIMLEHVQATEQS